MKFKWLALIISLVVMCNISAFAKLAWDDNEFISAEQLYGGLKGYGKTVFEGTKVEKFDIEVIGVLRNVDINFDMILIKVLNGPVTEKKMQSVAGMSGSPIYIDDKLIGAYAYGWNFQNEAIAGVTPIKSMLDCTEPGSSKIASGIYKPQKGLLKVGNQLITRVRIAENMDDAARLNALADPTTMILSPVSTPLFVTGLPDSAMKPLQAVFSKYNVRVMQGATMDAPGAGSIDGNAKLEAGSAVAVSLVEGDANLSAVGTVTYVKDDTALCFGHPFMGLGKINFPMSAAYVHGIISSIEGSFKLASPFGRVGTATSDRNFALAGTIGMEPDTIRAIMTLTDDSRKLKNNIAVDVCNSQQFTPFILYSWMMLGGASQLGNMQTDEGTYTADTIIMTDKVGDLRQHMVASPAAGGSMPMIDFMRLTDALINNPYEQVKINKIYLNLNYSPERNIAVIESVTPDRLVVKPGDTVNFDVKIRPYGKPTENTIVSVKIPVNSIDREMLVAIAGGSHSSMFKPLSVAPAVPEEGIAGIVRWLQSGNIAPNSLVAASLYPTLSYPHAGEYIRDLPNPLLETLMITDNGTGMIPQQNKKNSGNSRNQSNENRGDDQQGASMMMGNAVPTLYVKTEESKYILAGGSIIPLTIVQKSGANDGRSRGNVSVESPLLSGTINVPESNEGRRMPPGADNEEDYYSSQVWMTAQHKDAYTKFVKALATSMPSVKAPFSMPVPRKGAFVPARPLSSIALDDSGIEIDAIPDKSSDEGEPSTAKKPSKPTPGMMDEDMPRGEVAENVKDGVLLTKKRPSWGLTSAADFMRGEHFGTSVTSVGALTLSPGMKQIFNTGDMMPWRMAATADGIFIGGWRNNTLVKINKEGAGETIFPKDDMPQVKAVTAITNDAAGNIIFSTWPDNIIRQISADGVVKNKWELTFPVWDIAVTSRGKIYAASNNGSIYLLENDGDIIIICQLPDSHVYALAPGADGNLYMATAPQGKIYKLDSNDAVTAIANCKGTVASIAVDGKGNVYAGMAGVCRVIRITPDGGQTTIMQGMSGINRHVLSLKIQDGDLYAATGPAGGIYKIANPASSEPEVSVIYARADERTGVSENEVLGSESVLVTALASGADGKLVAAAAMPGQILQLMPRASGSFNSAVLTSPSVSTWGQFDAHIRVADGQSVKIESRTGRTATPDLTWSNWSNIDLKSMVVDSNPSLYAQFRITLNSADKTSPSLDYLKLYYTPTNSAPAVKLATPRTGEYLNGEVKLKWMGIDVDGDELIYCLYITKDDGKTWKKLTEGINVDSSDKDGMPMADEDAPKPAKEKKSSKKDKVILDEKIEELKATELTATQAVWNTKSVGDGKYRIKVVATDKYARPTDPKNGEYITGEFTVDNTAPEIVAIPDQIIGWKMIERMIVEDKTSPIIGGRFRIDNLPWVAITPDFSSFGTKRVNILLTTPNGPVEKLPKGNHTVQVQAEDAAGNKMDRTFRIEPKTKATVFSNAGTTKSSKDPDSKELIELMMYPIDGNK